MPTRDKVLVELTWDEVEALLKPERVIETNGFWGDAYDRAESTLRAALDSNQHEQVEEEYTVVADRVGGAAAMPVSGTCTLPGAEHHRRLTEGSPAFANVRIRTRTVRTSPWVDLDEMGEGS